MLDHQIISGRLLWLDLLVEVSSVGSSLEEVLSMGFFLVELDASLERAARMVTFDVFRKKPRAAP